MNRMAGKMKGWLARLVRDESGQGVLIMVLILLVLGALILSPLLGFMVTGLKSGQVHEEKTHEFYAADSGVEDAIYWLPQLVQGEGSPPYTFNEETNLWERDDFPILVNDKTVESITIEPEDFYFKITATAATDDKNKTTVIAILGGLLNNAITSNGGVDISPGSTVTGNIVLSEDGTLKPEDYQPSGGYGVYHTSINWPDADTISNECWGQVDEGESLGEEINIGDRVSVGPAYREGDLQITNTGATGATLTLNGTVYVSGNLTFNQPGTASAYIINLKGNTIYADGKIKFPSAGNCRLVGPGCIIARETVDFYPDIQGEEFIFVMSTEQDVQFKPNGDFYGSIAGNVEVDLKPGFTLTWENPPEDLTVLNTLRTACLSILSYNIG